MSNQTVSYSDLLSELDTRLSVQTMPLLRTAQEKGDMHV